MWDEGFFVVYEDRSVKGASLSRRMSYMSLKGKFMNEENKETGCFQAGCAIWILICIIYGIFQLFVYLFSPETKLISMTECLYAASQLKQYDAEKNISKKIDEYAEKKKLHYSHGKMAILVDQAKKNVDPSGLLDPRAIIKKYNSSTCRKLHGKEKFDLEKEMKKW